VCVCVVSVLVEGRSVCVAFSFFVVSLCVKGQSCLCFQFYFYRTSHRVSAVLAVVILLSICHMHAL